ncbi:MAG TPA: hypothetical protein VEA40_11500 [Ramlibacter sp.]|nr:hypothetical protein [Ramlibacter sp.]
MTRHEHAPADWQRRQLITHLARGGFLAGMGPLLASCGGAENAAPTPQAQRLRNYFFDLSQAEPGLDFFLVADGRHHPLVRASAADIEAARAADPALARVDAQHITHMGRGLALTESVHTAFIKGRKPGRTDGEWSLHGHVYHFPAADAAAALGVAVACGKDFSGSLKPAFQAACLQRSVLSTATLVSNNAACTAGESDAHKDAFDQAVAMVSHHPQIWSLDGPTMNYIQQAIICPDTAVLDLAVGLHEQGAASATAGGYATLVEVRHPDTGKALVSAAGDKEYVAKYSDKTQRLLGAAVRSVLTKVKNDPALGSDISRVDKTQENAALQGKVWMTRTARTSVRRKVADDDIIWAPHDSSSNAGFSVDSVDNDGDRRVTFTLSNSYLRYLGIYVRFLDRAGNKIALKDLSQANRDDFALPALNGTYDAFVGILNPEFVVLGIPVKVNQVPFSVRIPEVAHSFEILAGGLGTGDNSEYRDTVNPGLIMTIVMDLCLPTIFMATAAAAAFTDFSLAVQAANLIVTCAQGFLLALVDIAFSFAYHADLVTNLVMPLASILWGMLNLGTVPTPLLAKFATLLTQSEAKGQAVTEATDWLPGFGQVIQAVVAGATLGAIVETSVEVAESPYTYVTSVTEAIDVTVTITSANDVAGLPATAKTYHLTTHGSTSSPMHSGTQAMPAARPASLAYTFASVPLGGKLLVNAHFYDAAGRLVAHGSVGPFDNTRTAVALRVTEITLPLNLATVYTHQQKTTLADNTHSWIGSGPPPAQAAQCGGAAQQICKLVSLAIDEVKGTLDYVWQGADSGGVAGAAPTYQFARISYGLPTPQTYIYSLGGHQAQQLIAFNPVESSSRGFYLDAGLNDRTVHSVSLEPGLVDIQMAFAYGQFNLHTDDLLAHPTGKLVSLNRAAAKIEVLQRSPTGNSTRMAQVFGGVGERVGLLRHPVCIILEPSGGLLVLEQGNNRVQAFDLGGNPVLLFAGQATMPLKAAVAGREYLHMAVEPAGHLYVLSRDAAGVCSMDLYKSDGTLLATTSGLNAGRIVVDKFRNVYTLNFEALPLGVHRTTEPSLSMWTPGTA